MKLRRWSIIIPTLNEAQTIVQTLMPLQIIRQAGIEILLVDGGSSDETVQQARPFADQITISLTAGRGAQMNLGAELSSRDWLLFLHADTLLSADAMHEAARMVSAQSDVSWGRFDIRLSGERLRFRVIEWFINQRASITGVCTGDQGFFVKRATFYGVGGFPEWPLMEDVALAKRLRATAWPLRVHTPLITSSRRWESQGICYTILKMWLIRLSFWLGVSPLRLSTWYKPKA